MHKFWRLFGSFGLLHATPDDGGGGYAGSGAAVAEPQYEVPGNVGAGGDPPQDGNNARPTSTSTNPNSGGEPAGAASHDGAAPQTTDPNAPNNGTRTNPLPAGRSEEIARRAENAELATLRQQLAEQRGVIDKLAAVFAPPKSGTLDPKSQAVRDRVLQIMPELRPLLDLPVNDILAALKVIPTFQRQHDVHWNSVADRTMADVHKYVVPYVLGPEGTTDQLTDDQKYELAEKFRNWCIRDNTGARVNRYESGDPKLIEEFGTYFVSTFYTPAHRANVAAAVARAKAGQTAPRAGKSDTTGTPVPKVDSADEDAVHGSAWQHVKNALRTA